MALNFLKNITREYHIDCVEQIQKNLEKNVADLQCIAAIHIAYHYSHFSNCKLHFMVHRNYMYFCSPYKICLQLKYSKNPHCVLIKEKITPACVTPIITFKN